MENKLIEVLPEEVAQTVLNHVFNSVSKMRKQLDSVDISDENDKVNMKIANTIRLGVRRVRLDAKSKIKAL